VGNLCGDICRMTDLLTPAEASPIAGVPAVQLVRWAWLRVGPRNSGTRHRPKYHADDLREWREAYDVMLDQMRKLHAEIYR
jgi:hypothetical protein